MLGISEILLIGIIFVTIYLSTTNSYVSFLRGYIVQVALIITSCFFMYYHDFYTDYALLASFVLAILVRVFFIPSIINHFMTKYYIAKEKINMTKRFFTIGHFSTLMIHIAFLLFSYFLSIKIFGAFNLYFLTVLFVLFSGLLNFLNHRKLIGDVLSFFEIENAVFLFSLLIVQYVSIYIELGIILDIVMSGLILLVSVVKIKEIFGTIDTKELNTIIKDVVE